MITVRFPTGFSVQYNNANYATRSHDGGYTDIYTKKDGAWVAQVPTSSCLIEVVSPCRTYDASNGSGDVSAEVRELRRTIESLKRKIKKGRGETAKQGW